MASVALESPHACGLSGGLRVAEGPQSEGTEGARDVRGARGSGVWWAVIPGPKGRCWRVEDELGSSGEMEAQEAQPVESSS